MDFTDKLETTASLIKKPDLEMKSQVSRKRQNLRGTLPAFIKGRFEK